MALYSNTLKVIRQQLRNAVGDLILSTAGTPVSTTSFVDTSLRKAADYYNNHGYRAYCYSGSVIGQERDISDFATVGTVTLAPAFSATIGAGDLFELGHIFTEDECRKAINLSIEHIASKYLIDVMDSTSITLSAGTYEYNLPASFLYLHKVTNEDTVSSGTYEVEDVVDFRDWDIVRGSTPKLKLNENNYTIVASKTLRLEGHGVQATVGSDTVTINIPPDWLIQKAITFLPMSKILNNGLMNTYKAALELSVREPRMWPNELTRRVK